MNFIVISSASRLVISSSLRSDLKQIRDRWFLLLLICTGLVLLGIFLEEVDLWAPSGKPRLDMAKGDLIPSRWHKWKKEIARIGWILILLGVTGEGLFEAAISSADGALQDFNDTLLAIATEQAGDAATSAKIAHEEAEKSQIAASNAETVADKAQQEAGKGAAAASNALGLAKDARQEVAGAKQLLLDTEAKLEVEHDKRMELEKSLRPRQLFFIKYADGTTNVDNLATLARLRVIVESIPDFEAREAAADIVSILRKAGLVVVKTGLTDDFVWDGVEVGQYMPPESDTKSDWDQMRSSVNATVIEEFLRDEGWVAMHAYTKRGELPPETLRIRVGYKPNPLAESELPEWARDRLNKINAMNTHRETTPIPKNKPEAVRLRSFNPFPEPPKKPDK